ncbi:SRPBCC family protein [Catellatospora chokoriensis]|uniref:Actinorhodin polyketide synthase bifunctional cyclase/dehydratase n=1 Tax=Catellatospora chokoriensis TaxID=310353 RepID=A0A8J3NP66_9ACTN|nr:SRPBCC family protein [Catellatospora chokoriensis]GIF86848.1 actinorhodin polyketide synthase bifunctional cyclase/dehydratase [Catellatospora chokoriensis]
MSKNKVYTETQRAEIAAPAAVAFEIINDLRHWPQFFPDGVHAEPDADGANVRWWALDGDAVRQWSTTRTVDRAGLRVVTEQRDCAAPLVSVRTEWAFAPQGEQACEAELTVTVTAVPGDAGADAAAAQLEGAEEIVSRVKGLAERWDELEQLVISFEDPLFIAGQPQQVYEFLYAADKWPERVPHVTALSMTEDQPGVQFFDMDTVTPEGRAHTTRSVRVCLPHKIIYKQIGLPKLLDAHTGHWHFVETPEGVTVHARHTATIKPSALNLLGDDTTVADARRYLRRVLSTNSLQTLRHAQAYAEEPARAQ